MRKQSGITLIALVITIIVLLILAAVSISAITGENGIVDKAKEAAEKTSTAKVEEASDLQYLEEQIGSATAKPGMNEYGFYFDELYIATITEDGGTYKLAYLFHEDGSAEMFVDDSELVDGCFIGVYNIPEGTIDYANDFLSVSDDGLTLTEDGDEFVLTEETLHGAYIGEEYVGETTVIDETTGVTTVTEYILVVNADKTCTLTYTETIDGVEGEPDVTNGVTLVGNDYILLYNSSVAGGFSPDGNVCCVEGILLEKK